MLNKWIGIGRITKDPELMRTQQGTSVCSFTLAVDRRFVKEGEERQTDFINIVAFRNTAEFVSKHFAKGQMMNVAGRLQTRNYEDKNGVKRHVTEVVAEEVNFCSTRKTSGASETSGFAQQNYCGDRKKTEETSVGTGFAEVDDNADLPF